MPPKAIPGQLYSSSTQSFLANIPPFTFGGGGISEPGGIEHIYDSGHTNHTMHMIICTDWIVSHTVESVDSHAHAVHSLNIILYPSYTGYQCRVAM